MKQKPLGLDWIDILIQAGITAAIAGAFVGSMHGQAEDVGVAVGLTCAASLGIFALRRWWALRKLRSEPLSDQRVEELEARLAQLDSVQARMFELEERLDFAERLLAQQREPVRLPEGQR